jgi:hypothetical protein
MSWFGLATPPVAGRRAPGPGFAIAYGSVSFGLVSLAAYSLWAYRLVPNSILYPAIAAVYVGLGGLVLSRLVAAPGAWKKFPLLFALGFLVYAVGWCACWFGLDGKHYADLWGAILGLAGMTWLLQRAFGRREGFALLFIGLFALHSIGYYAGGELYQAVRGSTGRLLWGAAHGIGFGAGLGYVLARLQAALKQSPSAQ